MKKGLALEHFLTQKVLINNFIKNIWKMAKEYVFLPSRFLSRVSEEGLGGERGYIFSRKGEKIFGG